MKDTQKIAHHLNNLLARSAPYSIDEGGMVSGGSKDIDGLLYARLAPIIEAAIPASDADEIRQAASERRAANLVAPNVTPHFWRKPIPWEHSKRIWLKALPQLRAAIEADNAERLAKYEAYRLACEQGVAVAPAE